MGIFLMILGALAGLVVVVAVGALLPAEHTASVSRRIAASPDQVWDMITDIESQPVWRKDLQSVKLVSTEPKRWVETMRMGEVPMRLESATAPTDMVTRIDSEDLPFGGAWTFRLEPTAGGTQVTITENGVVRSPVFRFMSKFIFGHDTTLKAYIGNLETAFVQEAH